MNPVEVTIILRTLLTRRDIKVGLRGCIIFLQKSLFCQWNSKPFRQCLSYPGAYWEIISTADFHGSVKIGGLFYVADPDLLQYWSVWRRCSGECIGQAQPKTAQSHRFVFSKDMILEDYRIAHRSRLASIIGRQEVFSGKAKFGIFGDGKEVAQVAFAHAFSKGDFRSGYYRDQTLMFALELLSLEEFFAQLYGHADLAAEPNFGGRAMTGAFCHPTSQSRWKLEKPACFVQFLCRPVSHGRSNAPSRWPCAGFKAISSIIGPQGYRRGFSKNGNEIAFGTIGNAACAEGVFGKRSMPLECCRPRCFWPFGTTDMAFRSPMNYRLPKRISRKFLRDFSAGMTERPGIEIYKARGWDYPQLCEIFLAAAESVRSNHIPAIVHVIELTQPQGHSTSGSHERYKSAERIKWEREHDCLRKMREWIIKQTDRHTRGAERNRGKRKAVCSGHPGSGMGIVPRPH